MKRPLSIFTIAPSITELIAALPLVRRLETRKRLYALIESTANRLIEQQGPGGARSICIRRMGFCAHKAQGPRWTIWQQIHRRVREKTKYDKMRRA